MANKKFSEFELKTTTSDVSHVVGYNGVENVRITPANFLDTTGGPYLPLAGGTMTGTNGVVFPDNFYLNLGTSSDFEIYHDGNNSYLKDQGTGELILASNGTGIKLEKTTGEKMIHALTDGAVELYYDSVKKLETTSLGATVTGDLLVTGTITGVGGSYLPLAGGTLTGALTGTTATFTGGISNFTSADTTVTEFNSTDTDGPFNVYRTNGTALGYIGNAQGIMNSGANNFGIRAQSEFVISTNGASERFRINASGNSTFAGDVTLSAAGSTGEIIRTTDNTEPYLAFQRNSGVNGVAVLNLEDGGHLAFDTGATGAAQSEKMRLDASGNLGLGTSTPSAKLDVNGGANFGGTAIMDGLLVNASATGNAKISAVDQAYARFVIHNLNGQEWSLIAGAAGASNSGFGIYDGTAAATRLQIDSSGNSTFNGDMSINRNNQTSGELLLGGTTDGGFVDFDGTSLQLNTQRDPNTGAFVNTAKSNASIGLNGASGGSFIKFSTANADNTTATERMRLDASGNLLLGSTNTVGKLSITAPDVTVSPAISLRQTNDSAQGWDFDIENDTVGRLDISGVGVGGKVQAISILKASGNVGIGTSSPTTLLSIEGDESTASPQKLIKLGTNPSNGNGQYIQFSSSSNDSLGSQIQGTRVGSGGTSDLRFLTTISGTVSERMRITSGGAIGFNTTFADPNSDCLFIEATDNYALYSGSDGTGTSNHMVFGNANSWVGSITTNGSATAYNTSSDYRLKEDLQDFKGLELVSKIPVYNYKWKADESRSYGVMAHELAEVLPDAVSGDKDAEEMQGVDYSKIVPLLVKSIQELTAKVEKLELNK